MPGFKVKLVDLLRRGDRYFESDMTYIVRGGFWILLSYGTTMISSFALALIFANLLDPSDYAAYKYVLAVVGILSIATLPGVDTAVTRAVARGKEAVVLSILRLRIQYGVLASAGAILIALYYVAHANSDLTWSFVVAALFLPFMDPLGGVGSLLNGRKDFKRGSQLSVLSQLSMLAIIAGTVIFEHNVVFLIAAYFAGWTIVRGLGFWYVTHQQPPNVAQDPEVYAYGKHLTLMKASGIAAGSLGSIILYHVGGAALASFAIAVAPIEQLRGLVGNIESLALPRFAEEQWQTWTFTQFVRKTYLLFLMLSVGIIVYVFFAPLLFHVFFPKYVSAVIYSQVWASSLLLTAFTTIGLTILRAKQRTRNLHFYTITSISATLVCVPTLTYYFSIPGILAGHFIVKMVESSLLTYFLWGTPKD